MTVPDANGHLLLPRLLLRAAPAAYRRRYGDEMLAFCAERLSARVMTGESWLRAWTRIVADLFSTIIIEWVRVLTARRDNSARHRRLPLEEQVSIISREVLHAFRSLRKSPGFTGAAVLTLALGLASTTAIFSIVESVLLQPLPFPESHRIVIPELRRIDTGERQSVTYADFMDWRDNDVFGAVAVYSPTQMDLTGSGDAVRVRAVAVGPQFFAALGVQPTRGRLFEHVDYALDAARAVVISDRMWRTQFGSRPEIVGTVVEINSIKRPVIGVLPPGHEWPLDADVWVPLRLATEQHPDVQRRDNSIYQGIARLKDGATLESTRATMALLAARVAQEHPAIRGNVTTEPTPVLRWLVGDTTRRALWILLGAVGLLLLIACVNVANLQLARATARQRDLAVRTALGASRYRLVRQTFIESMLLGLIGGAAGVVLAYWIARAIVAEAPAEVPRIEMVTLNVPVLVFTFALSILIALLFGLVPALQAGRSNPSLAMSAGMRTSGARSTTRLRRTLVVAELALSVVLLVGAGLALRSIQALGAVRPGFDAPSVLTASISLPGARYERPEDVVRFMHELRDRLASAPGVRGAGISSASPLGAGGFYLGRSMAMEGLPPIPANEISVQWNVVTPGYFDALGIPVRGRDFTTRDDTASAPVMIVNEAFARAMFGSENPIGRRAMSTRDEKVYREIVGIVPNVKYHGLRDSSRALVWVPYAQGNAWGIGIVTVRANGPALTAVAALRREVAAIDRNVALANISTMDEAAARSITNDRLLALLLTAFATLALLLAAVGIFGVLSYMIAQRTRELGVRMALGARQRDVLTLVLHETAGLVARGIIIGVGSGLVLTRLMRAMLFGIQPMDPMTFAAVAVILCVVSVIAALLPARRAARVSPVVALRSD